MSIEGPLHWSAGAQDHEKPAFPSYGLETTPGDEGREAEEGDKWREYKNPYFDEKTGKAKTWAINE